MSFLIKLNDTFDPESKITNTFEPEISKITNTVNDTSKTRGSLKIGCDKSDCGCNMMWNYSNSNSNELQELQKTYVSLKKENQELINLLQCDI